MDMARAVINGWQSTYDDDGNDLGWGEHSVNNQMKHWPGDGAAEGAHTRDGAYNVFPGGQFWTHTLPFAACMDLPGREIWNVMLTAKATPMTLHSAWIGRA